MLVQMHCFGANKPWFACLRLAAMVIYALLHTPIGRVFSTCCVICTVGDTGILFQYNEVDNKRY